MTKIRWGVLGAARIATVKVIPAMQRGRWSRVDAIAARDRRRAEAAASSLGITRVHEDYSSLLADPEIDAVYIPLPNHLHVEWTIRAAEAGKHVLCEKPIGLSSDHVRRLIETRDRAGVLIQEAFMVRTHPQWLRARDLVSGGRIGALRSMLGHFSYSNEDPQNIRNVADFGGGGLLDIGCYLINTGRFIFGREPERVMGLLDVDPRFGVDRLASLLLDFGGGGHLAGTCGTQLVPYQRVQIFGTRARLDVEVPFNAPPDRPCRLWIDDGAQPGQVGEPIELDVCDQYTIQGDLFSQAILEGTPLASPLEDSLRNMACIEAVFRSARSGRWEAPGP